MVELQLPKLTTRVRFPSPAPPPKSARTGAFCLSAGNRTVREMAGSTRRAARDQMPDERSSSFHGNPHPHWAHSEIPLKVDFSRFKAVSPMPTPFEAKDDVPPVLFDRRPITMITHLPGLAGELDGGGAALSAAIEIGLKHHQRGVAFDAAAEHLAALRRTAVVVAA